MSYSDTIEPLYVVDTHALIWWLTNKAKLTPRTIRIFEAAEKGQTRLVVSAISIAEMYYANQKNKWFVDFSKVYTALNAASYIRLVPFAAKHVLNFDLNTAVPEMHDRIIAGVARRLAAPLITSDPLIVAAGIVTIVW
jgi:PIN domain nuclease of toxin-antitoxin system